jgi:hypothetical protein
LSWDSWANWRCSSLFFFNSVSLNWRRTFAWRSFSYASAASRSRWTPSSFSLSSSH